MQAWSSGRWRRSSPRTGRCSATASARAHSLDQRAGRGDELHVGVLEQEAPASDVKPQRPGVETCPSRSRRSSRTPGNSSASARRPAGSSTWTCRPCGAPLRCCAGLGQAVWLGVVTRSTPLAPGPLRPPVPPGCHRARPRAHRSASRSPLPPGRSSLRHQTARAGALHPRAPAARRRAGAVMAPRKASIVSRLLWRRPSCGCGRSTRGCLSAKTLERVAGRAIGSSPHATSRTPSRTGWGRRGFDTTVLVRSPILDVAVGGR